MYIGLPLSCNYFQGTLNKKFPPPNLQSKVLLKNYLPNALEYLGEILHEWINPNFNNSGFVQTLLYTIARFTNLIHTILTKVVPDNLKACLWFV